jgi:small-conductance mechanosensitive channel
MSQLLPIRGIKVQATDNLDTGSTRPYVASHGKDALILIGDNILREHLVALPMEVKGILETYCLPLFKLGRTDTSLETGGEATIGGCIRESTCVKGSCFDPVFLAFGASSLDFGLRIWTNEMTCTPDVLKSEVYSTAWNTLKEHGVEIPFPQRDLHVQEPIKVEMVERQRTPTTAKPEG